MLKVALIGSHGTGKTTICHELVAELKKLNITAEYLGEIAREAKMKGFKLNEGTTKESQKWIIYTQIAKELEFHLGEGIETLICDRATIDNYIYSMNSFGRNPALEAIIYDHTKTYDLLFKVPINPKYLSNDGVRSVDLEFQNKIDSLLESELFTKKISFEPYRGVGLTLQKIVDKLLGKS